MGMRIGMDYYPEWNAEEMWVTDAGRMKEAGVSMVRIGEFAWSRMEPDEDRFEFGWLDRAVEVMHRHGIDVIWNADLGSAQLADGEVSRRIPIESGMQPRYEGIRGHRCVNSPSFRKRTERIVTELAVRYGGHPAVIGETDQRIRLDRAYESILYGGTATERISLKPFGVEILSYR